uniref:Uncharacterized protein YDR132C n=1 Tax=Anthurium amnicola TaxID=1678845 RepID=A0A1D1YJL1_9ARAE
MPYRHNQNPNSKKAKKSRSRNYPPRTPPHVHQLADQPQYYDIKIGESSFCISPESLRRDAPNFFTAAFFGYFAESETTSIFIERDPDNFAMIVQYLRRYDVNWPLDDQIAMNNLIDDVKYYGFERLLRLLEQAYEERWPQRVVPWKIRTYAPETEPIVAINLKNIEIDRWDQEKLVYNVSPVIEAKQSGTDSGHESEDEDESDVTDNTTNTTTTTGTPTTTTTTTPTTTTPTATTTTTTTMRYF